MDEKKKLYKLLELAEMTSTISLHQKIDRAIANIENLIKIVSAPKPEKPVDYSEIVKHIPPVKFPEVKYPEVKIPKYPDYSDHFLKIYSLFGELMANLPESKDNEINTIKEEVETLKRRSRLGGGNMPQAWGEDSTYDGTLTGTCDGVNTSFVMRSPATGGIVFLYRNGALEKLSDYSVSSDNKTIIYSGFPPQIGDNIQSKYPK